jgi:DNA-binding transcriptional LysR family regulator
MLSLRQLEIFLAIADQGSTTAAAEQVARSQSAISSALVELETRLDAALFDRVGRRLVLNDNGERFYPQARLLMQQADALAGLFQEQGGQLRIGASTTIGNYVLPPLLAQADHLPCRRIEIANTREIAERIARCELELGLVEGKFQHPDLSLSHWQQDEMVIVAASHTVWATLTNEASKLAQAPWILRESGSGTRSMVEQQLLGDLEAVNIALELGSSEAIHNAVLAGLGISCLSRHIVQRSLSSGALRLIAPQRTVSRRFYIVRHRQRQPTPAVEQFLALCGQRRCEN